MAAEPPSWVTSHPKEDSFYRYFKGVSEPASSPAEALALAEEAARRIAIQERFGFYVSGSTSAFETEKNRGFTSSMVTQTRRVQLQRFERIEEWIQLSNSRGKYEASLLFRYPKQEEEQERLRLQSSESKDPDSKLWMSAEENPGRGRNRGSLKISSDPPDAEIWIDEVRWGTTPMQLFGRIDVGEHLLRAELPFHDSKSVHFSLAKDQTLPLHLTLDRRMTELKFETDYSGAWVEVVGHFRERAPTKVHRLPEGLEIEVKLTHPDAFPLSKKAIVPPQPESSDPVILSYSLEGRPAYLAITCLEGDSEISFDRTTIGKCSSVTGRVFPWPAGRSVTVVATKAGYLPLAKTLALKPDKTVNVKLDSLEKEPARVSYSPPLSMPWHLEGFPLDQRWTLGMGFGLTGVAGTWSLPFWGEFRLLNGLSLGYLYEFCAGPKYKGGGSGLYGKLHLSRDLYRGYFGYAESIALAGEYDDLNSNSFSLYNMKPWARSGYGYGLGYESYPRTYGADLGWGYRLGLREWSQGSQEFNGNLWIGIRF